MYGSAVDNREGDEGCPSAREEVQKYGGKVMEVLRTKHPEACTPTSAILDNYLDLPPELVPFNITDNTVAAVAGQFSDRDGAGGTDSVSLQHWILRLGAEMGNCG